MKKEKPYRIITGDNIYLLCMKGFVPNEKEEVDMVLATFDRKQLPLDAEEMAHTVCDLLNSQASAIQLLADDKYALSKKTLDLYRKIIPFGGPKVDG